QRSRIDFMLAEFNYERKRKTDRPPNSESATAPRPMKVTTPMAWVTRAKAAARAGAAPSAVRVQVATAWKTPTDDGSDGMAMANRMAATSTSDVPAGRPAR